MSLDTVLICMKKPLGERRNRLREKFFNFVLASKPMEKYPD